MYIEALDARSQSQFLDPYNHLDDLRRRRLMPLCEALAEKDFLQQPYVVIDLLADNAGTFVSAQEIKRTLWGELGEYYGRNNLMTAINSARKILKNTGLGIYNLFNYYKYSLDVLLPPGSLLRTPETAYKPETIDPYYGELNEFLSWSHVCVSKKGDTYIKSKLSPQEHAVLGTLLHAKGETVSGLRLQRAFNKRIHSSRDPRLNQKELHTVIGDLTIILAVFNKNRRQKVSIGNDRGEGYFIEATSEQMRI